MIKQSNLSIDIRSFWHAGTGRGSGSHLDALVERDAAGLPFVSGKMLKGLLRDAVRRAAEWDVLSYSQDNNGSLSAEALVECLFGTSGFKDDGLPREDINAGLLKFSDARMAPELINWLQGNSDKHKKLRECLFRSVYSTAINSDSGVAKQGSLRGQEVTVPMVLDGRVSIIDTALANCLYPSVAADWISILDQALPLVRAVGSNRTRGFGRAKLTLSGAEVVA